MNKIRDLRFGKKEKEDVIDPAAYSRDGYLIHQGRLAGVRYGCKTSKDTGCGWIACYNFLKFMGKPVAPLQVAYDLEGMLLWGGRIGSHPLAVWWYLHRRGFRFRVAFTRWGMERLVKDAARKKGKVAGVLAYMHKKGAHYTTFIQEERSVRICDAAHRPEADQSIEQSSNRIGGRSSNQSTQSTPLRFLNAVYGVENHRLTVREFFKKHVKFPICFVIVAR